MNWLLDTNVVSELRKVRAGRSVDPVFSQWAEARPVGLDFLRKGPGPQSLRAVGQVLLNV